MILERAELATKPGMAPDLVKVLQAQGLPLLRAIPGCLSAEAGGGIESPDKVLLLVGWESLAAHETFKTMAEYKTLGGLFGPYAAGGSVEHFAMG